MRDVEPATNVYHCAFSSYRRKAVFLGEIREAAERLVLEIAADKGYKLIAHAVMPDHVHLLLRLPRHDVSKAMNMFKGIMSRRILQQFPDLRMDMLSDHLWAAGYYARTVDEPLLATTIHYILDQGHPDREF